MKSYPPHNQIALSKAIAILAAQKKKNQFPGPPFYYGVHRLGEPRFDAGCVPPERRKPGYCPCIMRDEDAAAHYGGRLLRMSKFPALRGLRGAVQV